MGDFVVGESRAAGSRGARVAARAERAAERQKAERRAKVSCHRATVNGAEGGVPEEGDRVEWKFDEGGLFHECLARARRIIWQIYCRPTTVDAQTTLWRNPLIYG